MRELSLNGSWDLKEEPLERGVSQYGRIVDSPDGWMAAEVPGDIHADLIRAGRIPEPLTGLNSFVAEWVEDRSWWYRRVFSADPAWHQADVVELELDGLDVLADVFLNNVYLGRHPSAFRPFCTDVKELLRHDSENLLMVRLTPGLERVSREDIAGLEAFVGGTSAGRGDTRRVLVRKPQYSYGWDWNPKVPTCGITGGGKIRPLKGGAVRDVWVRADLERGVANLNVTVQVESLDWISTREGDIWVRVSDEDGKSFEARRKVLLRSGHNFVSFQLTVHEPRLWWPNGMGPQHLYRVEAGGLIDAASPGGKNIGTQEHESVPAGRYPLFHPPLRYGIRTLQLDQSRLPGDGYGRLFSVWINGVRTWCRGANWVPADSIYARVGADKYETLIKEAKEANFNMLRVWGGGLYEEDAFYEACDREGIMVWQDFMFACAAYPDHEEWFVDETRKEAEHQVVRLRNHPCLVLWCGNNENTWSFVDWWDMKTKGGARIYNHILPQVVNDKCPDIPYWNSSPYGGESPNSPGVGDRHHWNDCMMNPDVEKRTSPEEYDRVDARFISEYGYIGPCSKESTLKYLGGVLDRCGEAWRHHTNHFEKDTVLAGIKKHYIDPEGLDDDDFLLYGGLCQGLMYEYSLDSFRSKPNCGGGLFWMFNDSWGEVGWSIVDYYVNRKISFNFVRRANSPRRLILRGEGDILSTAGEVIVTLANDAPERLEGVLEYGYVAFDGTKQVLSSEAVSAGPFTREVICSFPRGDFDLLRGCLAARFRERSDIAPAILRAAPWRVLKPPKPELAVSGLSRDADGFSFKVRSAVFAHAVNFGMPASAKLSDEYFDLLPGEERWVRVNGIPMEGAKVRASSVLGGQQG